MKVTKTVKVAAKKIPARTKEVTKTVCDFCNADVPDHGSYGWYPGCSVCGRDCCSEHNVAENDYLDYTDWLCIICAKLYPSELDKLMGKHYAAIDALKKTHQKGVT